MNLQDAVRFFTEEAGSMACLSVACGDASHALTALGGVQDLSGTPVHTDSIFDLASLTKLFNVLAVFRLYEAGKLDIHAPVERYAPQFLHLHGISIDKLLGFEIALNTPQRVDTQPNRKAGLEQLFDIQPAENGRRPYSDMHAMVLKYIIEGASEQRWWEVVQQEICRPLGMAHTFVHVPESERVRCVSCDREHRLIKGQHILREGVLPGTPHDPKARLLNPDGDDCCGHAGLFATKTDMIRLCQGILRGDVLSRESLQLITQNRTGKQLADGTYTQFLGYQCYVKHPDQYFSEVPSYMGQQSIALSGFTGHHVSIDIERGIFALFLGSRVMDRLSFLTPEDGKTLTDYGLNADGTGWYTWPDGTRIRSSVQYVHLKDVHFHRAVSDVLGL